MLNISFVGTFELIIYKCTVVAVLVERPHNPMVNAGAILVLSLLLNLSEVDMSLAEKFDWVMNYFKVSLSFFDQDRTPFFSRSMSMFIDTVVCR